MSRPRLTAAAFVAALTVGACGGGSASDETAVKKAVKGFYNALADKDANKACNSISKQGQEEITAATRRTGKKQTCPQVFRLFLSFSTSGIKQAKNIKVSDVKVDGKKAKASVSLGSRKSPVALVKEGGDWKLSGLNLGR